MLSSARIAGRVLEEFLSAVVVALQGDTRGKIATEMRTASMEIIGAKGSTYYGVSGPLVRIVRADLRDEDAVLTVSSLYAESMQLMKCLCRFPRLSIGTRSVAFYRSHSTPANKNPLESSAAVLKQYIAGLGAEVTAASMARKQLAKHDIKFERLRFLGQTIYAEIPLEPKRYSSAHRLGRTIRMRVHGYAFCYCFQV